MWIGMPLTATITREGPTTEEEDASYQRSLAKLGIPLEMAQEEMKILQPRFEEATRRYMELQARLDRDGPAVAD
jgi:predicted RNase H-like nuclease (RuvC/YqgF family)